MRVSGARTAEDFELSDSSQLPAAIGLASVDRAFRIIEFLAAEPEGIHFADLRVRLQVNQGICFKLLQTLENLGYVFQSERSGNYCLTYKIGNFGLRHISRSRLLESCSAVLRGLADVTGELVRLAVVERDRPHYVLSFAGENHASLTLKVTDGTGAGLRLHTHANGKAWLSTLSVSRARALLAKQGLKPLTQLSLRSIGEVLADLETARKNGFATAFEEAEIGVGAVAAPIVVVDLDDREICVGTVSVAAPTSRAKHEQMVRWGRDFLVPAARDLASLWPVLQAT